MTLDSDAVPRTSERGLFAAAAVILSLVVVIGFARTYYLKWLFDVPPLGVLIHLHGILMTAWVALFATQIWLVSSNRVRVHQRLGYSGILLATLIILVGFFTAVRAAKFGPTAAPTPAGIPPLAFLIVPLTDLVVFAILFGGAIYLRRKPADHKRLMLLAAIGLLPPAIARVRIPALLSLGPLWFFGLPTALALIAMAIDYRRQGSMNRVFLVGTIFLIASFVGRLALMGTDAWMQVATWLATWAA